MKTHFSLGQFFALALLGLEAYHQQDTAPGGISVLLDPANTIQYLNGVLSILRPPAPPPPATNPAGIA